MTRKHLRRTLRNLLITALLAALVWTAKGFPLPTQEMALRRLERQHLAGQSDILLRCESQGEAEFGHPDMLLGVTDAAIHTSSDTHPLNIWPRNTDGPTLVVLPSELVLEPLFTVGLAAVDPPARTASAQLTITLSRLEWAEVYIAEGQRQGDVFLFSLAARHGEDDWRSHEREALSELTHQQPRTFLYPYTVEFFDTDGALLDALSYSGPQAEEVAA